MALAKFCHDFDTVKYLYANFEDTAIRVAALSNDKQFFNIMFYTFLETLVIKEIKEFISNASYSEFKAIMIFFV